MHRAFIMSKCINSTMFRHRAFIIPIFDRNVVKLPRQADATRVIKA